MSSSHGRQNGKKTIYSSMPEVKHTTGVYHQERNKRNDLRFNRRKKQRTQLKTWVISAFIVIMAMSMFIVLRKNAVKVYVGEEYVCMLKSSKVTAEDFVNSVYGGAYQPTNEFIPPSATGYNDKSKGDAGVSITSPFAVKADLTLAKQKLDAALATLGDTVETMPTFTLVVSDKADRQTAAQYIQDVGSKIGIQFKIDTIPGATFWPTMREGYRYDFALAGSGPDVDDASTFLKVYDGKGKYADTFMRWQNPEYAELLKQSWLVGDAERTELLVSMEEYLLAQGPVIPLYFTKAAWMLSDGFTNVNRNMTGAAIDFVFADKN